MATLANKIIKYVGSDVNFKTDVILENNGNGDYIKEWNLDIAKPTQSQLDAKETEANAYEKELIDEIKNKPTNILSGKQKLIDLGLTEAEIKALMGV